MNEEKKDIQIKLEIRKDKLLGLAFGVLSFIFLFLKWIKMKVSFMGYSQSESVSIFHDEMFDATFFWGMAKIFAIIAIILFVVYLASCFIDLSKIIPGYSKIEKFIPIGYFGIFAIALLFTFIGLFTAEDMGMVKYLPAFGWYFSLVFVACGFALAIKPNLVDKIKSLINK